MTTEQTPRQAARFAADMDDPKKQAKYKAFVEKEEAKFKEKHDARDIPSPV